LPLKQTVVGSNPTGRTIWKIISILLFIFLYFN